MLKVLKWLIGIILLFAVLVLAGAVFLTNDLTNEGLEREAALMCEERGNRTPRTSFSTDGCTFWPDTERATRCCIEHDMKYWCGGTFSERDAADQELYECLSDAGAKYTAAPLYYTFRIMGEPAFPFGFRWGYGHEWGKYR